eukprot:scpid39474/ scgid4420/ Retrovirus-related Pol polyprotein from transposon 297; Protease; Reverse transcriptase; Endonuclease
MTVPGLLNGRKIHMLVDTGASVSLLAARRLGEFDIEQEDILPPPDNPVFGAGGDALQIVGTSIVTLEIGQATCLHEIWIVNHLHQECLLGRDVLAKIPCKIQSDGQNLNFSADKATVHTVKPERIPLSLRKRVTIPPQHEMVAWASLPSDLGINPGQGYLTEPDPSLGEEFGVLAAYTITSPKGGVVPIRLINCSDEQVIVERDVSVGTLCPFETVQTVFPAADDTETVPNMDHWEDAPSSAELWEALHVGTDGMCPTELEQLRAVVEDHRDVFALDATELGRTHVMAHGIETNGAAPVYQPARRMAWTNRSTARDIVDKMRDQGIVEDSTSPWSAPIVLVGKKDGSTRFCVDYRRLNDCTTKDPFPLPRMDDTLDALGGAKYFSTLDLCSGYHQLPMKPEDKEKTAFSTPDGHYQFTVMPFGVCNGPSAFQRLMGAVLKGLQWQTCLVYLDDIIVFGRTFPEHLDRLKAIFARLRAANLRLKPSKCFLFREKVNFLGHVVTADGVQTDPAKIRDIEQWPTIRTVGQLRTFLGFSGYYRRFVRDYASIAKPLHALTHKGVTFQWTSTCEEAFNKLRQTLVEATTLAYPRFGPGDPPFVLDADASGVGLGAVLSQPDKDGKERPIAFASRLLNSAERRYGSTKCELLGMVWAVKHFRCYLLGREFLIRTDHRALQHWGRFKDPPAIIARWLEFLAEFQFSVQYRQGRAHANADGLSRCKEKPEVVAAVATTTPVIPSPIVQRRDWSHTNWAQAQSEDGDISQMGKWLAESAEDPDLNGTSPALHAYWRGRQLFLVKEGVVYRRWLNAETLESRLQILVPTKLRPEVLIEYHDMAGHAGVRRTYEQLHRRFYWHGMKRDVQDWVASCVSCSEKNRPVGRGRGASLQSSWAGYPFERIAMDLIPGLPETQNGNKH